MDKDLQRFLTKIDKKLDKILKLHTSIAKAMYLVPATEEELREIQIKQRENLQAAAEVNDKLDVMQNKAKDEDMIDTSDIFANFKSDFDVFNDVIGEDFIAKGEGDS